MYISNFHSIEEALTIQGQVRALYACEPMGPRTKAIVEKARSTKISVVMVDKKKLTTLVEGREHRGIVAEVGDSSAKNLEYPEFLDQLKGLVDSGLKPLVLILDGITDPHNLGALIRSSDKFGVQGILVPSRRSASDGPVVLASSAGAANYVPLVVASNLARSIQDLKDRGFWIWGADMNGQGPHTLDARVPLALVLGSEGRGLGTLLGKLCDAIVTIPTTGHVDSLNVSNAGAVLLYEVQRQRNFTFEL